MSNIVELLEHARRGDGDHAGAIFDYIRGFPHVVLRGAGKFGTAFGSFLVASGIPAKSVCYWDVRAGELREVNGLPVQLPFVVETERDKTLVINCIPNGSLSGSVGRQDFLARGYRHYLSGMALFEALMCGMKPETGFDAKVCLDTTFCNWCACKRLPSLLYKQCRPERDRLAKGELVLPVMTFVVNQKCTLECSHCGQYINHYPPEDRINFPLERIKSDIDRMLGAVDAVGYVSIIGGEPFLHPALGEIVEYVLTKPNFGVLGITTNGVCKISDDLLHSLNNGRTRLIFSDYTAALSDKQRRLFTENVRKVAESGISYTVGRPLWSTPASLRGMNLAAATKMEMKGGCNSRVTCKTVQNGVFYPCSTTAGMGSHRQADFAHDWVVLDDAGSDEVLRARILDLDAQPYYESCGHCGEGGQMLEFAGEQGVSETYIHIEAARLSRVQTS